ncbi:response regulator [Roseinatronobacter sp. NSM]|uniref:response regulator n=1 Tax=Roseinatronobacter sp. NSM TaxID=3457785 RepID=UPI0040375550
MLIVDDHTLLTETLVQALCLDNNFSIDSAKDICSAVEAIERAAGYDVVLLDYDLPGMDALEGLQRVIKANGGRVALFSGVAGRTIVQLALEKGANGFIPKTLPLKVLGHAIRLIADGEIYLPSEFMMRSNEESGSGFALKPREQRVLALLCEGLQNKEIGRELGLDEVIVKLDVKSICRKLDVRNRTQAVVAALKHGII